VESGEWRVESGKWRMKGDLPFSFLRRGIRKYRKENRK
jgi:hypothetical protein